MPLRSGDLREMAVKWAWISLGDNDHSHMIDPEEHLGAAMKHR